MSTNKVSRKSTRKRKSPVSGNSILALRDRTQKTNSFFEGLRYNVPLIPKKLKSSFINFANGMLKVNSEVEKTKQTTHTTDLMRTFSHALLFAGVFIFAVGISFNVMTERSGATPQAVAGVREENRPLELGAFEKWMIDQTGFVTTKDEDDDQDGLTNYEEFLIGSNPTNGYSCGNKNSDVELVLQFINPATCKPINMEDEEELSNFSKLIDFESIQVAYNANKATDTEVETADETTTAEEEQKYLLSVFGASNLQELNQIGKEKVMSYEEQLQELEKQEDYIKVISKIDDYMQANRSWDPFDRNYEIPVGGAVYLYVSQEYEVPLKYVLAIAQRESRFGTDRYTNSGNLTRPGEFENIVSMGLDDSGNNMSFGSWEGSLVSFGEWYRRFDDAGVDDCSKWRIYNPNGDYCERVEETASQIEYFLNS